jgi:hypothetical protein|tara:strand:+ start:612 stop:980 length:369 start_codon:yes stop_codon:yes gene_type:complete
MQSLNKEMMKVLNKTTLQVSRYQTDKTRTGYQEKLEWFVNEKQLVNKLNEMRSTNILFDKFMTKVGYYCADTFLSKYGAFWTGVQTATFKGIFLDAKEFLKTRNEIDFLSFSSNSNKSKVSA